MKTPLTTIAITLIAFTARASDLVPYIAMPVGSGYATDAKGVRHPSEFCMRDAVFAPPLPYSKAFIPGGCPTAWNWTLQGSGLYRLDIATRTGLVTQVTISKSMGSKVTDDMIASTFKRWIFRPGKWKEIIIPTTVRQQSVGVTTSY